MSEPLTLEALEKRVAALEALQKPDSRGIIPARRPWQSVVGMFEDNEFSRMVDEEGRKIRETEREQARIQADKDAEHAA